MSFRFSSNVSPSTPSTDTSSSIFSSQTVNSSAYAYLLVAGCARQFPRARNAMPTCKSIRSAQTARNTVLSNFSTQTDTSRSGSTVSTIT
ncbi:hypothetical protein BM221_001445 [Beauveria bassiana]|uniref:Uncharacterized protein n=1 Tax=Beauveria bassiana TaxID=176275 RepID=A0A2N6NVR6_BEABA|nr:hypothetical protein BM221_001445 [Beauveria bassiana]